MSALFEVPGLNIYIQIVVTAVSVAAHLFATRNRERTESVLELVTIYTIGLAGWFSIVSGILGHIIYADAVATSIGWPLNSGFQTELAFASIGVGIVGFCGFWIRSFWLPFAIAKSTFLLGAGLTHIRHAILEGNLSPSNTGVVLYWDFVFPLLLIGLLIIYQREQRERMRAPAGLQL